jgi:hypothetical protein
VAWCHEQAFELALKHLYFITIAGIKIQADYLGLKS